MVFLERRYAVNVDKTIEAMKALRLANFPVAFEHLLDVGDVPYVANRQALTEFDIHDDREAGLEQIEKALVGIEEFKRELELFRNAARAVAKRAFAAVR